MSALRTHVWAVALILAVPTAGAQSVQQTPLVHRPKGSAVLMGQVVDARGKGVSGVLVTLNGGLEAAGSSTVARPLPGGPRTTFGTSDGRFVFFDLPAGSYSIEATKPGYLPGAYGRKRFGGLGQSLTLRDGERQTQIAFAMWEYCVITGRVVDEAGEPLVGVAVRALPRVLEAGRWRWDTTPVQPVTTDDRGEYRFDRLVPGDYVVVVPSTQVTEPASLAALAGAGGRGSEVAADAGQTRRFGLVQAGDWTLLSSRSALTIPSPTPGGPVRVYPTIFSPASRSTTDAEVVSLRSGEERTGVNVQLALVATATVSGAVVGPEPPPPGLAVRMQPDYLSELTTDRGFESGIASTDSAGRFVFLGVTPGQYSLRVAAAIGAQNSPERRELAGAASLTVNEGDARNVVITVDRGVTVSGRIAFDGALPPPRPEALQRFAIRLDPADPGVHRSPTAFRAAVDRTGSFRIADVRPGKYVVKFSASAEDRRAMEGWESAGATLAGRDVSTRPMTVQSDVSGIVLTLSDHAGRVSGVVHDASGRPDPSACVMLFTTDRELWVDSGSTNRRIRGIRAAEDGTFVIQVVHEGEYFLSAIPEEDAANWDDPRVLDLVARRATRVIVGDNERKTVSVTTRPIR